MDTTYWGRNFGLMVIKDVLRNTTHLATTKTGRKTLLVHPTPTNYISIKKGCKSHNLKRVCDLLFCSV